MGCMHTQPLEVVSFFFPIPAFFGWVSQPLASAINMGRRIELCSKINPFILWKNVKNAIYKASWTLNGPRVPKIEIGARTLGFEHNSDFWPNVRPACAFCHYIFINSFPSSSSSLRTIYMYMAWEIGLFQNQPRYGSNEQPTFWRKLFVCCCNS